MNKRANLKIEKSKLILVEGTDATYFMIWALQAIDCCREEIQVMNFGGNSDLKSFLQILKLDDNFSEVTDILIFRDAENNPVGAQDSVVNSLRSVGYELREKKPFKTEKFIRTRIGFGIFPGAISGAQDLSTIGTLEDLCLRMISDEGLLDFANETLEQAKSAGFNFSKVHKTKLYLYLALKDGCQGLKLGEAAKVGIWNWRSKFFEPYIALIQEICA